MNRTEMKQTLADKIASSEGACFGVATASHKETLYFIREFAGFIESTQKIDAIVDHREIRFANGCRVTGLSSEFDTRGRELDGLFVSSNAPEENVTVYQYALVPRNPGGIYVFNDR